MEFESSNLFDSVFLSLALRRKSFKRGVSNFTPFSGVFLEGEVLSDLILRSDVLIELPLGPIDEDIGLPRREGGRDCRGELLLDESI